MPLLKPTTFRCATQSVERRRVPWFVISVLKLKSSPSRVETSSRGSTDTSTVCAACSRCRRQQAQHDRRSSSRIALIPAPPPRSVTNRGTTKIATTTRTTLAAIGDTSHDSSRVQSYWLITTLRM